MANIITVDQNRPARDAVDRACDVLVGEGVLVMPTDSVYGIGCLASPANPALWRVFDIKHRDRSQTLPWLVADEEALVRYSRDVPASARRLAAAFWPGALTLVVVAADVVPAEYVLSGSDGGPGTIALRMPDSNLVREVARGCGMPRDQRQHARAGRGDLGRERRARNRRGGGPRARCWSRAGGCGLHHRRLRARDAPRPARGRHHS